MGIFSRTLPATPEQQAQTDRDAAWNEENSDSLAGRGRFPGMSDRQADRHYPVTGQTDRIAGT